MTTQDKAIVELNRLYNAANKTLYRGELPPVMITIQSNRAIKASEAKGWYIGAPVWHSAEQGYQELSVSAEYLGEPIEQIVITLLHEIVHHYCNSQAIQDTSRQGRYHNKAFKAAAESHGLEIGYDKKIGWSLSSLNAEGQAFLESVKPKAAVFACYRQVPEHETKSRSKKPKFVYQCPECGAEITSKTPVSCRCEICEEVFELVSSPDPEEGPEEN